MESITLLIAEVLEKLNNKRYEKTYREDLLPISKNDVFLVFRDLFITVINRSPVGRRAAAACVGSKPRHTLLLSSGPQRCSLCSQPQTVRSTGARHTAVCYLRSRETKQQWVILYKAQFPTVG